MSKVSYDLPKSNTSPARSLVLVILALYWVLLFAGTHIPRVPVPPVYVSGLDKICHFVGCMGLAFLLALGWSTSRAANGSLRAASMATVFLIVAIYGTFDELTQPLVGRTCELGDWIADLSGALMGLALYSISTSLVRRYTAVTQ